MAQVCVSNFDVVSRNGGADIVDVIGTRSDRLRDNPLLSRQPFTATFTQPMVTYATFLLTSRLQSVDGNLFKPYC
jgi:hypothetical protein